MSDFPETPFVAIDTDILLRNIHRMQELASRNGKTLRPHAKTHKCAEIGRMQIEAGAVGLTVAKTGEAEAFAKGGIQDLFLAHQILDPRKLDRLAGLTLFSTIRLAADSVEVALAYAEAASRNDVPLEVRIECDSGLGRAGVRDAEEALAIYDAISKAEGLSFDGLFTHEGHMYGFADKETRKAETNKAGGKILAVAEQFRNRGLPIGTISVGSTPGAEFMAEIDGIDEIRTGTYALNDVMQMRLGSASVEDGAISVYATVISKRSNGRVLIDAGTKTFASDCPFPDRTYGYLPDHPDVIFTTANEEHGYLDDPHGVLMVGDIVRVIPNHACTCVNMHFQVGKISHGVVSGESFAIDARGAVR